MILSLFNSLLLAQPWIRHLKKNMKKNLFKILKINFLINPFKKKKNLLMTKNRMRSRRARREGDVRELLTN